MAGDEGREQFEYWLTDMDDAVSRFIQSLPDGTRAQLDYSRASLGPLEAWILSTFPSHDDVRPASAKTTLDGAARYVGETFRRGLGGRWTIHFHDPKQAYHGIPVIDGVRGSAEFCPLFMVTASADRRTGEFLGRIYDNMARRAASPT